MRTPNAQRALLIVACAVAPAACAPAGGGTSTQTPLPAFTHSVAAQTTGLRTTPNGAVSVAPASLHPSATRPAWLRFAAHDAAGAAFVYVSQFAGTPVEEYHKNNRRNGPPVCSLPGTSVNGIAVDAHGNVWVPSGTGGGQGVTQEYAPNCGAAELQIVDPNGQPADAGFDSKGNVYILNIFGAAGAPGSINIYTSGGTLTGSLTDPTFNELIGIGTDRKDDIFVSNRDSNGNANVVEFRGGKMPGKVLTGISLGLPGAPQLDRAGNLIITDWNALTLNVYAPPYTSAPAVTQMQGLSLWCPLTHNEKRLYCANLGAGSVDVYAYPTGAYLYSFTNGLSPSGFASGVALDPAAPI